MAFTKSTVATNNISNLANKPLESAPILKQKFDQYGIDDKVRFNALIDELEATTGTSGAENIGSKTILGVTGNTPHAQITDVKAQLDARNAENVKLTGNQTVAGIKTFTSSPVVPVASADTQAPQKKYVDDENLKDVHLTGNQTISGVKTFSSSPVVPTPTTPTQASNKSYVDTVANNFQLGVVMPNSILNSQLGTDNKVGSNALLETVNKTDSVSAINEVNSIAHNASFKNKIINGNFDIWQRGTSQTVAGFGSADRWQTLVTGSTFVLSRQSFLLGQTDVPDNPDFYCRTVVTSVAGASNRTALSYTIEDVTLLSGKTITLSFYAKADASKNIAIEFTQSFGTGGSPSTVISGIDVTTIPLTTSWSKHTVTITVPSISGKTLGTDNNDYFGFVVWFDAGSSFNSRTNSLGQQSGTFDISKFQLELGSIATTFEQRTTSVELTLCERYYEKTFSLNSFPVNNSNDALGALSAMLINGTMQPLTNWKYRTQKRRTPTVTLYNPRVGGTAGQFTNGVADTANARAFFSGTSGVTIDNNFTSTSASGVWYIHASADSEL